MEGINSTQGIRPSFPKWVWIGSGVVILAAIAIGGFLYFNERLPWGQTNVEDTTQQSAQVTNVQVANAAPTQSKKYSCNDNQTPVYATIDDFRYACYLLENPSALAFVPEGTLRDGYAALKEDEEPVGLCESFKELGWGAIEPLATVDQDKDGLNGFLELLYHADDTKADTDGDGYSDLTEVQSSHDPNDIYTLRKGELGDQMQEVLSATPVDIPKVVDVCCEYQAGTDRETCLAQASGKINDPTFCDNVDFPAESYEYTQCKNSFLFKTGNPQDCLNIVGGSDPYICLEQYAKEQRSLKPCELLEGEQFKVCAGGIDVFSSLPNSSECYTYQSRLDEYQFDECIKAVAHSTKNPSLCFEQDQDYPGYCVERVAYEARDPSLCEILREKYGEDSYQSCVRLTPDGRNLVTEQDKLRLCETWPTGFTISDLGKQECFLDLAVEFNKETYCENAAAVDIASRSENPDHTKQSCLKSLMIEKKRADLCSAITIESIKESVQKEGYCL